MCLLVQPHINTLPVRMVKVWHHHSHSSQLHQICYKTTSRDVIAYEGQIGTLSMVQVLYEIQHFIKCLQHGILCVLSDITSWGRDLVCLQHC